MKLNIDPVIAAHLPALEAYFREREGVLLAYLYGSHARGTAGPLSDVDVALLLEGEPSAQECFQARLAVTGALMDLLRRDDVDVVVLNEAPPALAFRVIRDGVLLYSRSDVVRREYVARVTIEYLDFQPCLALYERAVLERARRGELTRGPNSHRGALERYLRLAEGASDLEEPDEGTTPR
jgi:uncharacterized protein